MGAKHRGIGLVAARNPSGDATGTAGSARLPVIGLAGGIGSGKSTVAALLESLGAVVISSDAISQEELDTPEVRATLQGWWGPGVLRPDGSADRRKIADVIFADPPQRHRLEALLHPRVMARRARRIAEIQARPDVRAIVLDSPLLYETGLDLICDCVLFVDALMETRLARVARSRGWSADDLARREKNQQPLDMKRARADYICRNNSEVDQLRHQVEGIFSEIVSPRRAD